MNKMIAVLLAAMLFACLTGCGPIGSTAGNIQAPQVAPGNSVQAEEVANTSEYNQSTLISEVIGDPAFGDYGRLIFPTDDGYYSGNTLGELGLTWYNNIDPNMTVEITNYLKDHAAADVLVFYDIYTPEEKAADPDKEDTGLFFFRGNAGEKFAVCNAGGGFAYVGAMQDSFPHALTLSKEGYNAFAQIYRPSAQTACEDLARAISFIFAHAEELEVDTECYLCGAARRGHVWQPILVPMAQRSLAGTLCPSPARS